MNPTAKTRTTDPLSYGVLGIFFVAAAALSLSGALPLTYDEAWTYIEFARHGVLYSASHYPLPNNHVAFSVLEAVMVPDSWVESNPLWIRLGSLGALLLTMLLLQSILRRLLGFSGLALGAATIGILLCSPLGTLYALLARGYGMGTLLLLVALDQGVLKGRSRIAAVSCALAVWTVPTFAFAIPGIFLGMLWQAGDRHQNRRTVTQAAAIFLLLALLLYVPILGSVLGQGHSWNSSSDSITLLAQLLALVTNAADIGFGVAPALGLLLAGLSVFALSAAPLSASRDAGVTLVTAVASALLIIGILLLFGIITTPFVRALSFVPLFLWLALLTGARFSTWQKQLALALLGLNAAAGLWLLIQTLVLGNPQQYPLLADLNPSPLSRTEASSLERSERLVMGWDAVPAGRLYARAFDFAIEPRDEIPLAPCVTGQFPPAPTNRASLPGDGGGLLCF